MLFKRDIYTSTLSRTMTLISCVVAATAVLVLASDGNRVNFPPVPKGIPYKLSSKEYPEGSNGLYAIASGLANILRSEPPYGKNKSCSSINYNFIVNEYFYNNTIFKYEHCHQIL